MCVHAHVKCVCVCACVCVCVCVRVCMHLYICVGVFPGSDDTVRSGGMWSHLHTYMHQTMHCQQSCYHKVTQDKIPKRPLKHTNCIVHPTSQANEDVYVNT